MAGNKEITVEKGKFVTLKAREVIGGYSLFFVYYINKSRKKENLESNISSLKKPSLQDKDILKFAKMKRAEYDLDISKNADDFIDNSPKKILISEYIDLILQKGTFKSNTKKKYTSLQKHLNNFSKFGKYIHQINESWLEEFKLYLSTFKYKDDKILSRNSADRYFSLLKSILIQAERDKIISKNYGRLVKGIGKDKSLPKFLTLDELKILSDSPYNSNYNIKEAFLFSCYTGFRFSDICNLKWTDVFINEINPYIIKKQIKTCVDVIIPLKIDVLKYLPNKNNTSNNVFSLPSNFRTNLHLDKWTSKIINKKVTFHMARHTFGTLIYNSSSDIYITSKLMGHTDIKHTQRYANALNESKINAINNMPVF